MDELYVDARRQVEICNACRYCEGYCPVFPAIERRNMFDESDLAYLANLCHDCKDCYSACPYTLPHELRIDIPGIFARIRARTHRQFSYPQSAKVFFDRKPVLLVALWIFGTFLMGLPSLMSDPGRLLAEAQFYDVIPRVYLIVGGLGLGFAVLAILLVQFWNFFCYIGGSLRNLTGEFAFGAFVEAMGHKWF